MEPDEEARGLRLRRAARWSFVAAALCAILAAIDLDRFLATGMIVVGRERQVLTGTGAQVTIGLFAGGALGFFAYGVHAIRALRRREIERR